MSTSPRRIHTTLAALALLAGACGGSDDATTDSTAPAVSPVDSNVASTEADVGDTDDASTAAVDYEVLGLWDEGPCDASLDPLIIGNLGPHESPVLSLMDHVRALDAAAAAFNARGGANGHCIQMEACDDQNTFDAAVACVEELDDAGVVATVNDSGTIAQGDVSAAFAAAGIPRVGGNVAPADWADPNAYPVSASSTSTVLSLPGALVEQGITDIAIARVDLPEAGAAVSLFESVFGDDGATFPADLPVPAGTTDYTQFALAAQDAGAEGIVILLGEQEAMQVVRAGDQLASELQVAASLGSFAYDDISALGDAAARMTFVWGFPPATADVPVYEVVRADLAASGDEELQAEQLKAGAMQSWVSLYALLRVIRDAGMTEFSRETITAALGSATDVPMLGIFGDATWTPAKNYEGQFQRIGVNRLTYWTWDPSVEWNGRPGNFALGGVIDLAATLCGSLIGAPEPC